MEFIVANYDSVGKRVLGRTYSNLNPSSLVYEYDGEEIVVNDEKPIYLEVGSFSDPIGIESVDGPVKSGLTLTPYFLN